MLELYIKRNVLLSTATTYFLYPSEYFRKANARWLSRQTNSKKWHLCIPLTCKWDLCEYGPKKKSTYPFENYAWRYVKNTYCYIEKSLLFIIRLKRKKYLVYFLLKWLNFGSYGWNNTLKNLCQYFQRIRHWKSIRKSIFYSVTVRLYSLLSRNCHILLPI